MAARSPAAIVVRDLAAPIDRVFAALTTPELMARWMSPIGHAEIAADVRAGGSFRLVMVGEGRRLEHTGTFLVVEPPHRLAFTWLSEYTGPDPGTVTITLAPRGTRTLLTLAHEGLPDAVIASHEGGWSAMVGRLDELLTDAGDGG